MNSCADLDAGFSFVYFTVEMGCALWGLSAICFSLWS